MRKKSYFAPYLFVLLSLITGCSSDAPAPTAIPVAVQSDAIACPEPMVGTSLFTNAEDGFCLLLPDGYAVDDSLVSGSGGGETAVYVDSLLDTAHPRLYITVDDAHGQSLAEIAAALDTEMAEAGFDIAWTSDFMLGGVPAVRFDQVPGQELERRVLAVADDRLFSLTFVPDNPNADANADFVTLTATALESFVFLPGTP